MKRFIVIGAILILFAGGYLAYNYFNTIQSAQAGTELETVKAEMGSLITTTDATGTVRANQSASLSWETSGTVGVVELEVGDQVTTGQVLATLERSSLPQQHILAQVDLIEAQKALDDLLHSQTQQAQANKAVEEAQHALEKSLNPELTQANALETLANAEKAVEDAQMRMEILTKPPSQATINLAYDKMQLAEKALNDLREEFDRMQRKLKGFPGYEKMIKNMQLAEAKEQLKYEETVENYERLLRPPDPQDVAVAEAELATAQAHLKEAQREWERAKDGPNQADITLLEAQLDDAKREMERLSDGPDPDDIAAAKARVAAAQATLDQVYITAPFDGILTEVISQPGDQVNPGTLAFRIDDLSHLLVDLEVSEVDINQVEVGQQVILTFDAILAKEYHGQVTEVAMTGSEQQGVVNFKVTVELTDPDEDVKPGMTSAVSIVTTQIEKVLLVPNRAVRVVDGERVVYVLSEDGEMQPIPITLGASSDTHSQIIGGDLQPGNMIVLNPPSQTLNAGPGSGAGSGIFGGGN